MQLTQATDYSFRVVLYLAGLEPDVVVTAKDIAEHEEIPMRYLLKTLRSLVKAGILHSFRGPEGGYALAKEPHEISLLDVVEAVEGPIAINRCFVHADYCTKHWSDRCPVHQVLGEIQHKLAQDLARHNFGELLQQYKNCRKCKR
ncbi:MAG TPA: Rrf2 family transcriptional regulator [Clostridia bacterium]|nr:Rrf2 family transcriptional regulator [Clostridia bacterium]